YILDGMNAERILIGAECVGDGRWFVDKASRYASERVVFGRPIGQNQGVQFPIAHAHAAIEAADLMRQKAAWLFEQGLPCGAEANMAKLLAPEASGDEAEPRTPLLVRPALEMDGRVDGVLDAVEEHRPGVADVEQTLDAEDVRTARLEQHRQPDSEGRPVELVVEEQGERADVV